MEKIRYYLVGKLKFFPDLTKKSTIGIYKENLCQIVKRYDSGSFLIYSNEETITTKEVTPINIWVEKWKIDKKRDLDWLIKAGVKNGQGVNYRIRCNMITLQCERNLPESKELFCHGFFNLKMPVGYNYLLGYSETIITDSD